MSNMDPLVVEILHDLLVSPKNQTKYPSKTFDYNPEFYSNIMDCMADWFQTGYTVCGAADMGVLHLNDEFGKMYPSLKKYSVVRVIDRFLNEWNSETLLEFSNEDITDAEYKLYEEIMEEEDGEIN